MRFVNLTLNGTDCKCFVFTKWELSVFGRFGANKKAPDDELAVRLCVYDGRPVVWATDGAHVVIVEPDGRAPEIRHAEFYAYGPEVKKLAQTSRVSQSIIVPVDTGDMFVTEKPVVYGTGLHADVLGSARRCAATFWNRENFERFDVAARQAEEADTGAGRWTMSPEFAVSFAAVAKAAPNDTVWCFNPPADAAAPMVMRVHDTETRAVWSVMVMPTTEIAAWARFRSDGDET